MGRWSHFYGGYSSAKSLTCWNIIREAQAKDLVCVYYNIENQYLESWAKNAGIDTKKLIIVEGTTIEGVGKKLEGLLSVAHVHVLDSLAAAISVDELAAKIDEWQMGLAARAWGKVFRKVNERFDDVENCIIMVNQTRDSFGYGGGELPTGGRFIEYMSSMSLHFRKGGWLFRDANGELVEEGASAGTMSGDKEPEGLEFAIRVQKSRVSPPFRTARLRMDFSLGKFDEVWSLAKGAKFYNIVERTSEKSSYFKLPDGSTVQGEAKLRQAIQANPELRDAIAAKMRAVADQAA